jgi:hypothetical protein
MSTVRSILSATLVAATLSAATLGLSAGAFAGPPPPPPPHHHHGPGWGWGLGGLAAGVMLGSALAPRPVYAAPIRCTVVERVNRYGQVIGTRRVCTED